MGDNAGNREAFDAMIYSDLLRLTAKRTFGVEASNIAFRRRLSTAVVAASLRRARADGFADYCDYSKTWTARRPFLNDWLGAQNPA